jgi:hypothetical protein
MALCPFREKSRSNIAAAIAVPFLVYFSPSQVNHMREEIIFGRTCGPLKATPIDLRLNRPAPISRGFSFSGRPGGLDACFEKTDISHRQGLGDGKAVTEKTGTSFKNLISCILPSFKVFNKNPAYISSHRRFRSAAPGLYSRDTTQKDIGI